MFGIGSQELLILFLVVLLLFGAKRIPEVARVLGKGMRDFKKAAEEIQTEIHQVTDAKELLQGGSRGEARSKKQASPPDGGTPGKRGESAAPVPPAETGTEASTDNEGAGPGGAHPSEGHGAEARYPQKPHVPEGEPPSDRGQS